MLTAIEFINQADGKVGKWFAKRSKSLNDFNKAIITDGANPDIIADLSEKFGTLILPVQHYAAAGSVYHMMKGPFTEYLQDGIVGSELASGPTKSRSPRSPRKPSPASSAATKTSPAAIAMMARHTSRFAARALVVAARAQEMRNVIAVPDSSILTLARNFRAAGKAALAEALENDYYADAAKAASAAKANRETELAAIMAALVKEYGADAVAAAVAVAP